MTTQSRIDTEAQECETGFGLGWGWFVALGATLVILGALGSFVLASGSTASVFAIGIVMVIGAFTQLGTTFLVPGWRGTGLLVLSAALYGAAGIFAIVNPTLAAQRFTLGLALALIFSGLMRIRLTSVMPSLPGWVWVAASGFVSIVAGLILMHLSLANAVWFLGMALASDLAFQGAMTIAFGIGLKVAKKQRCECLSGKQEQSPSMTEHGNDSRIVAQ